MTHLNDLSKVYLESIAESAVPGKPAEKLGAVTAIPKSEQDAARERILAKTAAKRAKMKEALDPVGQENADIDNDDDTDKTDEYLHKRRKAIGKAIRSRSKIKESAKLRLESYHNLIEVSNENDENDEEQIKEKEVNNKIVINPEIKESLEEIGATLIEMVEVDEFDFIVEGAYLELLEEGYEEDDIEEALEYALTEAKVTFGHDTASNSTEKKKSGLLDAARKKLAGAKTAAKAAVARGARKVAKGALGVARKMEGGDSKPSAVHTKTRTASTYRGAGAGTKERVSSGSYTPPTKKKAEKPSDPWEGSATTPPKAKAKKSAAPKAKAAAAPKRKRKSKLDSLLADIRSESVQQIDEMPYQVIGSPDGGIEKKIGKPVKSRKYADARAAELADTHKATGGKYRSEYVEEIEIGEDAGIISGLAGLALGAKGASYAAKHTKRMRDYPKNFVKGIIDPRTYVSKKKNDQKEEFQIDEKALSRAQQRFMGMVYAAKKGEMPASAKVAKAAAGISKKEAKKFAKTKHKGLPEKVEEQQIDPKAQQIQKKQIQLDRQKLHLKMQQASKNKTTPSIDIIS